jgi:ligand-binding sensor domain-containing protein/signal transduction histidine kinase
MTLYGKALLAAFLFIFTGSRLLAQHYPFFNLGVENGLIQSQATCLTQDHFGNLWIGTLGGLSRYDGKTVSNYSIRNGLSSNIIRAVTSDEKGTLWIGTPTSVCAYYGRSFVEYPFTGQTMNPRGLQQISCYRDTVWSVRSGSLYFITKGKSYTYAVPGDGAVTSVLVEAQNLWVAKNGVIYNYHNKAWTVYTYPAAPAGGMYFTTAIYRDKQGLLWLATNMGLYRIENNAITSLSIAGSSLSQLPVIYSITQDNENNIWLGLAQGAAKLTTSGIIYYNKRNGLCDNTITSVFTDREGNVWLATDGVGVYRYSGTQFTSLDESMGLPSAQIMAIDADRNGQIFLGTYDAGLYSFNNGEVKPIAFPGTKAPAITSLQLSHDGKLWIGTRGNGLWRYDNIFKNYVAPEHHFPSDFITCLYEDTAHNLWIGFSNGAVWRNRDTFKSLPVNAYILSFLNIGADSTLIEQEKGLKLFSAGTVSDFKTNGPADSSTLECMTLHNNELWIGTSDNGIICYNLATKKSFTINKSNGLQSDFIYNLIADNQGNIWAGTGYGIHKISRSATGEPVITFYGKGQSAAGMESNLNASFKMRDGSLWFGTTNGALHYIPNTKTITAKPVSIVLQSVKLFGEPIKENNYFDSTDNWYGVPYGLHLPYRKNNITFTFQAITLSSNQKLLYRYKIDGLDAPWSDWTTTNSVTYSALPPGKYTFIVECNTGEETGKVQTLSYPFEIITPFTKTKWFRLAILGACILLGIGLQYIVNNAKQRRQRLLAKLRGEEQAKIRMRTAEDFHDEVGNKITRINVLTNVLKNKVGPTSPDVKKIFEQIEDNTGQLYSGTRDILWSLQPSNDSLYEILHRLQDFGNDLFQDTDIEFIFTGSEDKWRNYKLPMDVSRNLIMIFKEALNNTLKYSKATIVKMEAVVKPRDILHITLTDNGKGFDMDKVERGHGINNMNIRAARIHGRLYIDTRENKGTYISLSFKIPPQKRDKRK